MQLESAGKSWFARLASGNPGVDPYVTATSDVYQDLFGEGSFTGKGIYDLQAFERALQNAFPENSILSHDLIEAVMPESGWSAASSSLTATPLSMRPMPTYSSWVRGDWQFIALVVTQSALCIGLEAQSLVMAFVVESSGQFTTKSGRSVTHVVDVAILVALAVTGRMWTSIGLLVLLFPLIAQLSVP